MVVSKAGMMVGWTVDYQAAKWADKRAEKSVAQLAGYLAVMMAVWWAARSGR